MNGKRVATLATDGFEQVELTEPRDALRDAGVVKGRRVTSYPSLEADLANAGAEWIDDKVVVDGGMVTSRKPDDLPAFTEKVIEVLGS